MHLFDIQTLAFKLYGYPVSYVELIGTLSGLVSIFYATKANILTWPTGIINELFLFILFFQVHLYADMFLQLYFFAVTIFGWFQWNRMKAENTISSIKVKYKTILASCIGTGTIISGFLFLHIHLYLPQIFKIPAAYPFTDSFVMISSIFATILLAKKKIENWILWIAVDLVCVVLYFIKGVYFLSAEYIIFLGLASYGLYHWNLKMKHG